MAHDYLPPFGKTFPSDRKTVLFVGGVLNLTVRVLPLEEGAALPRMIRNEVNDPDKTRPSFFENYICLPIINAFENISPVYLLEGIPIDRCRQILARSDYWVLTRCDEDTHWQTIAADIEGKKEKP